MKNVTEDDARQVIKILDKVLAKNEAIIGVVEKSARLAQRCSSDETREKRTAMFVIMHYSNLCALGGGASGLPGIIPGLGLIYSLLGSSALDAFLVLKFELEMSLALAHLAGRDIADPRERKLAFLHVCAALEEAYDVEREPTLANILDLAMGGYSTRELSKTLAKALARVLMLFTAKKWARFFPLIGIGIEASVNKVLTSKLGRECWRSMCRTREAVKAAELQAAQSDTPDSARNDD